ncbi:zinc finger SWIM domain-containing protein 1-like [Bombina bombina]|uniref:zinc finger SWIM domain-containing protein 1-like n=1 Tax=Bombina bombina TaxID=8345 RepID=UPI00235A92DF|nr:zinc finger SWIM domain-containing protein 1-like [Bombina bombina]XP_053545284.1 zinc finger SWIM domain-containing protein 1-like [Bombina bombina]XP_053545311.1 zinc finger SWIM domain-containing protein 1-like [Bombina bombina]
MASALIQELLEMFPESQLTYVSNKDNELESLNFQTTLMSKVFLHYPEILLVFRTYNNKGKHLYTFLADGPRLITTNDMTRIVHVAIPESGSFSCLDKMFNIFKDFNPKWTMIKIFLVDPRIKGMGVLSKAFPSAEIIPSAFHICRNLLEYFHNPAETKALLVNALRTAMRSATMQNLQTLHMIIIKYVSKAFLRHMDIDLLLDDRIWAVQRWRNEYESVLYYQNMEATYSKISELFVKTLSFEINICSVAKYIQESIAGCGVPDFRTCNRHELALLNCLPEGAASQGVDGESETVPESAIIIRESLDHICTPAASKLCSKELAIAVESMKLISAENAIVNIQLIENPQHVWDNQRRCTCYFNQFLQLPCRHIMAVLVANKEDFKAEMISSFWWRKGSYSDISSLLSADVLEILNGVNKQQNNGKQFSVENMMDKIMRSLAQCNDVEFERRYNALREMADSWIGPYEQVKL